MGTKLIHNLGHDLNTHHLTWSETVNGQIALAKQWRKHHLEC